MWDELRDVDPDDYTIATVPDFVAGRDDPWAGNDSTAQSLEPLLEIVKADEESGLGELSYNRCPASSRPGRSQLCQ